MFCILKDFKTFDYLAKYDVTEYIIATGEAGYVDIFQPDAVQISTKYVGCWLIIGEDVLYVTGCTPSDVSLRLSVEQAYKSFNRPMPYNSAHKTWNALVRNAMTDYINGNGDSYYALPYIDISVSGQDRQYTPARDEDGYFDLSDAIENGLSKKGKKATVILTNHGNRLSFDFTDATEVVPNIVFDDGHSTLESETYDYKSTSKATVVQTNEDKSKTTFTFYLGADHKIYTSPPANRMPGIWKKYGCTQDEEPLSVATGAFSANIDSHKIEFWSDKQLEYYQTVHLRLREAVFETRITAINKRSSSNRFYYRCGNLAATLTEKIKKMKG